MNKAHLAARESWISTFSLIRIHCLHKPYIRICSCQTWLLTQIKFSNTVVLDLSVSYNQIFVFHLIRLRFLKLSYILFYQIRLLEYIKNLNFIGCLWKWDIFFRYFQSWLFEIIKYSIWILLELGNLKKSNIWLRF